jgi:hypothetical protein
MVDRDSGRACSVEALRITLPLDVDDNDSSSSDVGERRPRSIEAGRRNTSGANNPLQCQAWFGLGSATQRGSGSGTKEGRIGWRKLQPVCGRGSHLIPIDPECVQEKMIGPPQ